MENVKEWLELEPGDGWGRGLGSGDGSGRGSGWGSGLGSGDGWGSGWFDGWGSGDGAVMGSGVKSMNGQTVYTIDNVQTIIVSICLNLAKGFVLNDDLTTTPCYVVKGDGLFAHGETPGEAQEALRKKVFERMETDEAIEKFCETFKADKLYSGHDFFEWHHYLTGSCEMGRKAFVSRHDLDLDKEYTVSEFIELTEDDYGGEVIRKLKERYE